MKERQQAFREAKVDFFIARIAHYVMVAEAAVSSTALAASVPLIVIDALPTWADIVITGGGLLLAPSSIHEIYRTSKWLREAKQRVQDFEDEKPPTI